MELRRNTSPRSIVKYNVVWLRFDCLKIKLSSNVVIPLLGAFQTLFTYIGQWEGNFCALFLLRKVNKFLYFYCVITS